MLQSLNHLTLAVSNLQSSLTFWRDLLGLQLQVLTLPVVTFGSVFLMTYPVATWPHRKVTIPITHSALRQKILSRSHIS